MIDYLNRRALVAAALVVVVYLAWAMATLVIPAIGRQP